MPEAPDVAGDMPSQPRRVTRRGRSDARRNLEKLLQAASDVFATSGADVPVRDIATRAGVGVGTLYRHFPRRADLVAAVFRKELDECADAAEVLSRERPPFEALSEWMQLFTALAVTKRGLAAAMLLADPAFDGLPERREQRLRPAFNALFNTAVAAGAIRTDVDPVEFLDAASSLCMAAHDARLEYARRMVALLTDALRRQQTSLASTSDRLHLGTGPTKSVGGS